MIRPNKPDKREVDATINPLRRQHDRNYAAAIIDDFDDLEKSASPKEDGDNDPNSQAENKMPQPQQRNSLGPNNGTLNSKSVQKLATRPDAPVPEQSIQAVPRQSSRKTSRKIGNAALHGFSPYIAKGIGVAAATVFQFIRWHCLMHGKYTGSFNDLLKVYPYLTRKQLRHIIQSLTDDVCYNRLLVRRHVRARNGYEYLLADPKMKLKELHWFDRDVAVRLKSISCAVILDDLTRWIVSNDEENGLPEHYESPAQWAKAHPYMSLRTVERCFSKLAEVGEIELVDRLGSANTPLWTIPLGRGRMDRWHEIHHQYKEQKPKKEVVVETRYVPVLFDPDCHSTVPKERETRPEAGEDCGLWTVQTSGRTL